MYIDCKGKTKDDKKYASALILELNSRLGSKRIVHIGDSHSRVFEGISGIITAHIGPATAYNISNNKSSNSTQQKIDNILKNLNKEEDALLLSFGEIDIRANIIKSALKTGQSIMAATELTAKKYFNKINELESNSWKVLVHLPHASGTPSNPDWPAIGTEEERNTAILAFNSLIASLCSRQNIPFASMAEEAINPITLKTNYEIMTDGCHLNADNSNQTKLAEKLLLNSAIKYGSKNHPHNEYGEIEVAHKKTFKITSRHHKDPLNKHVLQQSPYFFHTDNNSLEGIEIDLEAFYHIKRIALYNRTDGYPGEAPLIRVGIVFHHNHKLKNKFIDIDSRNHKFAKNGADPITIRIPNLLASRIQITTKNNYLHLSNIKVFASYPRFYDSESSNKLTKNIY